MVRPRRYIHILLIVLAGFLGLSAVPGGLMLLVGFHAPLVEHLKGSVCTDFTIPGLALLLLVGGSALLATVLLVRRSRFGLLTAILAGVIVMAFEFVEVLAIGSPQGPARVMQLSYFGLGLALVGLSLSAMVIDARWPQTVPSTARRRHPH
jgi:hypothetical protein